MSKTPFKSCADWIHVMYVTHKDHDYKLLYTEVYRCVPKQQIWFTLCVCEFSHWQSIDFVFNKHFSWSTPQLLKQNSKTRNAKRGYKHISFAKLALKQVLNRIPTVAVQQHNSLQRTCLRKDYFWHSVFSCTSLVFRKGKSIFAGKWMNLGAKQWEKTCDSKMSDHHENQVSCIVFTGWFRIFRKGRNFTQENFQRQKCSNAMQTETKYFLMETQRQWHWELKTNLWFSWNANFAFWLESVLSHWQKCDRQTDRRAQGTHRRNTRASPTISVLLFDTMKGLPVLQ